jgi:hypothetical protein
VLDLARRTPSRWVVLVDDRVGRVRGRDIAGHAVERRREEQRLTRARAGAHDAVDRRPEAHVEHAVGLVEDEDPDCAEVEGLAREQILETSGGRDDDVGARGDGRLLGDSHAAVDRRDAKRPGVHDRLQLLCDLRSELAGGRQHERRRAGPVGVDHIGHRDPEGERLARAGRGLDENVATGEHVADHEALDGEGMREAATRERVGHGFGYAEIGEGLR